VPFLYIRPANDKIALHYSAPGRNINNEETDPPLMIQDKLKKGTVGINSFDGSLRGSGFFLHDSSTIITNAHVVGDSDEVDVTPHTGDRYRCQVKVSEMGEVMDYAVLEPVREIPDVEPIGWYPNQQSSLGDNLYFAGKPLGLDDIIVQAAKKSGTDDDGWVYLDGSVNKGNSGGPVVDAAGRILGIVTTKAFASSEEYDELRQMASELTQSAKNARGYIQVGSYDPAELQHLLYKTVNKVADAMERNASTGIGMAQPMEPVIEYLQESTTDFDKDT
jgi:S1-C subfamily serine protease